MTPLGPWDGLRRVAVAVSGGADSLALALLAGGWGDAVALIVDHGLRPGSASEAEQTRAALAGRGLAARVLTLTGLAPGAGLPARARAARYAALEDAAAGAGLVDLLVGHQAGDQAETVVMRGRRGSGPVGLAGMAAVVERDRIRLVRPLLSVAPGRLRATVRQAGLDWVEDPSNTDMAFTRARVRAELQALAGTKLAVVPARVRQAEERAAAAALAGRATLYPEGYAVLTPGPIAPAALARLLRMLAGRDFEPSRAAVAGLAGGLRPATLGGVRVMAAGRLGPGWLLVRESAAMAAPVAAVAGAVWDGRFRLTRDVPGAMLGALGSDAAGFRGRGLPGAVLRTIPVLRRDCGLFAVPFVAYAGQGEQSSETFISPCMGPACGAVFLA